MDTGLIDLLSLWLMPAFSQGCTGCRIIVRIVTGRSNRHCGDQTPSNGGVECIPAGLGWPAFIAGETVAVGAGTACTCQYTGTENPGEFHDSIQSLSKYPGSPESSLRENKISRSVRDEKNRRIRSLALKTAIVPGSFEDSPAIASAMGILP